MGNMGFGAATQVPREMSDLQRVLTESQANSNESFGAPKELCGYGLQNRY